MQNANITISSAEETPTQIKIRDEHGKTWSFFKTKKAGGTTVAYEQWTNYKIGDTVGVGYDERQLANGGMVRAILTFQPPIMNQPTLDRKTPPRANLSATAASQPAPRNFDREAYEKCCSIWAAAVLGRNNPVEIIDSAMLDRFWNLFQAIRKDGEKRFATGWQKAQAIFGNEDAELEPEPDLEAGNRAIEEAQASAFGPLPIDQDEI